MIYSLARFVFQPKLFSSSVITRTARAIKCQIAKEFDQMMVYRIIKRLVGHM